jgi:hypothetical protein
VGSCPFAFFFRMLRHYAPVQTVNGDVVDESPVPDAVIVSDCAVLSPK